MLKIKNLIFYLTLLFLPTQFGKHFWPSPSFIQGLRIDYLSPTIYFTDLLVFLLFVFMVLEQLKHLKKFPIKISNFKLKTIFLSSLVIGMLFSKSPLLGLYGLLKLGEFTFFAFYIANYITKKNFPIILFLFSAGVLFESTLSIAQFLKQSSINGIFYFFGERTFYAQTPGIANASLSGELILRPYGTFSHPNVLAAYLVIIMAIIISKIKDQKSKIKKILFLGSLLFGSAALFATMSRVAILLWAIIIVYRTITYLRREERRTIIGLLVVLVFIGSIGIIFFSPLFHRFESSLSGESFVFRKEQIVQSLLMIKDYPLFGVGLNNYLINLPSYSSSVINPFQRLQPVHNIYFLVAAQTGIIGLQFFLLFIAKTLKKINKKKILIKSQITNHKSQILFMVLFLGLFDHYFLTIQQGQLLLSLVLGFCWNNKMVE